MSGGVFAVSRAVFDHELFADETFTEREAWIWLIREAAWKDRRIRVGDRMVNLKRGQCGCSVRFMAERWRWHRSKVERFLKRLKSETMIETASDQGILVITVCKYNEYQRVSLPDETPTETPSETSARQSRDKQEDRGNTGENISLRGAGAPDLKIVAGKTLEAQVYAVGKTVLGKSAGGVITNLRKACGFDDAGALEVLAEAADKENPMEWLQGRLRASTQEARLLSGSRDGSGNGHEAIPTKAEREYALWEDDYYRGAR